jgi:hypothetical protein
MMSRIRLFLAATAVLVLCRVATERGQATVVRDGTPGNPAVQTGGHPLQENPSLGIAYGVIGAWRIPFFWPPQCAVWPWSVFNPFYRNRYGNAGRSILIRPGGRVAPVIRIPPPVR